MICEIKLFAIVRIFYVSDFLRLFMMSFKYGVILLKYSSTDSVLFLSVFFVFNIVFTPKITYSYWFVIIFFIFMLKKILNIYKYSIFNCFIFFSSLKIFLISLIMFSSSRLKLFIIICYWKKYFFKKIKVCYTP